MQDIYENQMEWQDNLLPWKLSKDGTFYWREDERGMWLIKYID